MVNFKDKLKTFKDFKNKQKSVWSNVFWFVKVCIFWKCFQHTIDWDKREILKKFRLDKINGAKNTLLFLSRAPTHHSFTFNLRFLYDLKHKVRLSKTVCGIFDFWFRWVFIKVYIFVRQNARTLWLKNAIIPVKINKIERPNIVSLPDLWFLSWKLKFREDLHSNF